MAENDVLIEVETLVGMLVGDEPLDAAGIRFVLDALTAATDSALGFLSAQIECHTAQNEGGAVQAQLAALRSQARSREEKAAVALIAARAAEGAGDSATACDLLAEALELRPGFEPALHDAAQYAAARGDYVTADRYLRRSDIPSPLRAGLSEAIAATPPDVGRNMACPCGSGRKYKVCCRLEAVPPLSARAQLIYALLGTYAERAPGLKMITPLIERTEDAQRYAMFMLDLALFHGGLVEKFLAARGHWLRPDERQLIEDWQRIPVTLYEAVDVVADTSVTLRALPDGDPLELPDALFSQTADRLELFCGRILHDGTTPRMLTVPVHVLRQRRRELAGLLAANPSMEEIAVFLAPEPPIQFRNSDGDDLSECTVTYQVPDPQQVLDRLSERLTRTDEDVVAWHRQLPDGRVVNLGLIQRTGDDFTVAANSFQRLATLETQLRDVAPEAVETDRHTKRVSEEPDGREGRTIVLESYFLEATTATDANDASDRISRNAEASWLDTTGVIGELSPREAAASDDPAIRAELRSIIDDVEAILLQTERAGQSTTGLMSPHRLREALGVR
ncbi:MAG: SEC-C metal-binding domain-containing protein [Pseudonocardiaceae bacterium]